MIIPHHHSKLNSTSNHIIHINSFNPHTNSTRKVVLLSSLLSKWGNWIKGEQVICQRSQKEQDVGPALQVTWESMYLTTPAFWVASIAQQRQCRPQSHCHFHWSIITLSPPVPCLLAALHALWMAALSPSVYHYPTCRNSLWPMALENEASTVFGKGHRT